MFYELINDAVQLSIIVGVGYVIAYLRKRIADEKLVVVKNIAKDAVIFTQQVFGHLDGKAKLRVAVERVSALLAERGIKAAPQEIEMFIESAVKTAKKEFADQW